MVCLSGSSLQFVAGVFLPAGKGQALRAGKETLASVQGLRMLLRGSFRLGIQGKGARIHV